jgi:hypothetical protein
VSRGLHCPECNAPCWREEVDVGVGIIAGPWMCGECAWDEDQAFPMAGGNWNEWLGDGPKPDDYRDTAQ